MNGSRQTTFRFLQSMQKSESEARSWRLPFLMRWAEKIKTYNFFAERYARKSVNKKLCKICVDKGFSG